MINRFTKLFTLFLAIFALFSATITTSYAAAETTEPIVQAQGEASDVSDTSVTVEEMVFSITPMTTIVGTLENGVEVVVLGLDFGEGEYVALEIVVLDDWTPPNGGFVAAGLVTAISAESLTIEDTWGMGEESFTFILDGGTVMPTTPVVGDFVYVEAIEDDDLLTATYVEVLDDGGHDEYAFYHGTVTALSDDAITIETEGSPANGGGESVTLILNSATYIDGTLEVGSEVYVEAIIDGDSQTALLIVVLDDNGNGNQHSVIGEVEAISAESITIIPSSPNLPRSSKTYLITDDTFMWTVPEVGDEVLVEVDLDDNQAWVALSIEVLDDGGEPTDFFEVIGEVTALTDDGFVVDGETYTANGDTFFENDTQPAIGDTVYAFGIVIDDVNILTYVAVGDDNWGGEYFDLDGIVESISDTEIVVDGTAVVITADTEIEGEPQVGDQVYIGGMVADDGTLTADYIVAIRDGGGSNQPYVEAMGVISTYAADTSITINGVEFAIDADTMIEGTPAVDLTAYIFGVVNDDGDLVAAMIAVLDEGETEGIVESLSPNQINVGGTTFNITAETHVVGSVAVGDHVRVGTSGTGRAAGGNALLIEQAPQTPTAVGFSTMTAATPSLLVLFTIALSSLLFVTNRIWVRNNK